jgi:hypothetical protein
MNLLVPLVLLSPTAAWAQQADHPLLLPQSDVTVTYRFDRVGMNDYHKWLMTYADGGQRVRLDYFRWYEANSPFLTTIYDRPANRFITIHPESKSYAERPIGNTDNPGQLLKPDMSYTRLGAAVVAFTTCTDWKVQFRDTDEADTACVTDDGIMLRVVPSKPNIAAMAATNIHYGTPTEGTFDPPPKFKREPAR